MYIWAVDRHLHQITLKMYIYAFRWIDSRVGLSWKNTWLFPINSNTSQNACGQHHMCTLFCYKTVDKAFLVIQEEAFCWVKQPSLRRNSIALCLTARINRMYCNLKRWLRVSIILDKVLWFTSRGRFLHKLLIHIMGINLHFVLRTQQTAKYTAASSSWRKAEDDGKPTGSGLRTVAWIPNWRMLG